MALQKGKDFCDAPLSEKDGDVFDLSFVAFKHWYTAEGVVTLDAPDLHPECAQFTVDHFEATADGGVVALDGLLSQGECDQIVQLCDAIGFEETKLAGAVSCSEALTR